MPGTLDELLARIRALEDELEREYARRRDAFDQQRVEMAERFLEFQRRHRIGLWPYLLRSRWRVLASAPLIYAGWPVFLLLDLFLNVFQAVCFPVYGIALVPRREYLVLDRAELPYLNAIEKFNCFYCSYANGVVAFAREVASRTEQYWCPIKHARRLRDAHLRYAHFAEHGDAEAFRQGLARLRRQLAERGDEVPDDPAC
ncbi:MAG: hypothetical protein AB7Q81_09010 [Gammaproteobacteria bacterium]